MSLFLYFTLIFKGCKKMRRVSSFLSIFSEPSGSKTGGSRESPLCYLSRRNLLDCCKHEEILYCTYVPDCWLMHGWNREGRKKSLVCISMNSLSAVILL